jgi:hypothetical protein
LCVSFPGLKPWAVFFSPVGRLELAQENVQTPGPYGAGPKGPASQPMRRTSFTTGAGSQFACYASAHRPGRKRFSWPSAFPSRTERRRPHRWTTPRRPRSRRKPKHSPQNTARSCCHRLKEFAAVSDLSIGTNEDRPRISSEVKLGIAFVPWFDFHSPDTASGPIAIRFRMQSLF